MALKGHKVSQETRQKIREKLLGIKLSKEHRNNISKGLKDSDRIYYVTPETKSKISKTLSGRKLSKEHIDNISKALLSKEEGNQNAHRIGAKYSKEWCENISKAKKGKKFTKKHIDALVKSHNTDSYKKKMGGNNNPSKRPEVKAKISKKAVERIKNSSFENGWAKSGYREDIDIFVRSSWEANMVRLFNYLNIPFQYEPKIFSLEKNGKFICRYLPDFYLFSFGFWIEVKGRCYPKDLKKVNLFRQCFPELTLLLIDQKRYKIINDLCALIIPNWE